MTRQQKRNEDRQAAARAASAQKIDDRKEGRRALLRRQSAREKSGFYGFPVARARAESRSRVHNRKVQKGQFAGRILRTYTDTASVGKSRSIDVHATKGIRSYRIA